MEDLACRLAIVAMLIAGCGSRAPTPIAAPAGPSGPVGKASNMASTSLELAPAPDGQGWTLAFRLKNTTTRELRTEVLEPFVAFELEITSVQGEHLSLAQPAFSVPGRPRAVVLAPGDELRLETPFRLRFDPSVPPAGGSDPMVWSIRSPKVPAVAHASFELPGIGAQTAQARLDDPS
jgi:hypothetical protein